MKEFIMKKSYANDTIWKQIQEYLPRENRLNDGIMPKEEWLEIGGNTIHIDHYSDNNEKGVILSYISWRWR